MQLERQVTGLARSDLSILLCHVPLACQSGRIGVTRHQFRTPRMWRQAEVRGPCGEVL